MSKKQAPNADRKKREAFLQLRRAINSADIDLLGWLSASELAELAHAARKLQDRLQEQMEYLAAPDLPLLKRFRFQEDGPAFYAEAVEDGVLINPALPKDFHYTCNEERNPEELARWWLRPFIEVETWEQMEEAKRDNFVVLEMEGGEKRSPEEVDAMISEQRAAWFKAWPSGKRFDARCLDGGAWDRPTSWGMFATLEQALACIEELS